MKTSSCQWISWPSAASTPPASRDLGYTGKARWVAFWWDDEDDDVAWNDGTSKGLGEGAWETWTKVIAPVGAYFKHNHRANLGGAGETATHLLVYDRAQHIGFVAPKNRPPRSSQREPKNQNKKASLFVPRPPSTFSRIKIVPSSPKFLVRLRRRYRPSQWFGR